MYDPNRNAWITARNDLEIRFAARATRDTTPRGATRVNLTHMGGGIFHRSVTTEEQTFLPGVDALVSEELELTAYTTGTGTANLYINDTDTIVGSIEDPTAPDLDLRVYAPFTSLEIPTELVTELRWQVYRADAREIRSIARWNNEDPSEALAELRELCGL